MRYYVSLFPDSDVLSMERYGAGAAGPEGSLEKGVFTVSGQPVMCTDSTVKHAFDFTPSMSLFVDCSAAQELGRLFEALSDGGSVFMPPDSYGFSEKFAWVQDKYGVSWQLNLPHAPKK